MVARILTVFVQVDAWSVPAAAAPPDVFLGLTLSAAIDPQDEVADVRDLGMLEPWNWAGAGGGTFDIRLPDAWIVWRIRGGAAAPVTPTQAINSTWAQFDPPIGAPPKRRFVGGLEARLLKLATDNPRATMEVPADGQNIRQGTVYGQVAGLASLPQPIPSALKLWTALGVNGHQAGDTYVAAPRFTAGWIASALPLTAALPAGASAAQSVDGTWSPIPVITPARLAVRSTPSLDAPAFAGPQQIDMSRQVVGPPAVMMGPQIDQASSASGVLGEDTTADMLILDEADSLLRDRAGARASWEVTQVNEMLTWMERHPYPFICTTNLMDSLDPATLRRFLFKIRFLPMRPDQAREAFRRSFGIEPPRGLDGIENLTPGDFALAARKAILLRERNANALVEMLEEEANAKIGGARRRIGF